jgi:hypothetical protein
MTKKINKSRIPRSVRKKLQEYKRAKKAIAESHDRLLRKAKERANNSELEVLTASPGIEKMSEIIIDFAQPLLDAATNAQAQKQAITTAIIGWNLSLFPKKEQVAQIEEIKNLLNSSTNSDQLRNEAIEIFNFLLARKKSLYPEINRLVVDYELIETPKGFHLNVVSNFIKNKNEKKENAGASCHGSAGVGMDPSAKSDRRS